MSKEPRPNSPLSRALRVFETQQAIADVLGIRQPSVAGWKEGRIPVQHITALIDAAKARGRRLTALDLLPQPADQSASEAAA